VDRIVPRDDRILTARLRVSARKDAFVLTILTAALYGVSLGARDLWNPNEPIYGEAVREMNERGSWLVPYVNGLVFGEKPILYYWMALASSMLLGGVSELSLRIPAVLAGIGTVLGTYAIVLPYAGRRRAVVSAVVAATMYGVWWNARFVQMDILVTATTAGVILAVTWVVDHGAPAFRGWALAGAFAGLGFLAKGPVGWICPGLVLGVYLAATRRLRALVRIEVLVGAAVAIAVAAPWYVTLAAAGHTDILHEVLIRQNFSRFSNPWDHARPFWYYLGNFLVDMAPGRSSCRSCGLGRRDEGSGGFRLPPPRGSARSSCSLLPLEAHPLHPADRPRGRDPRRRGRRLRRGPADARRAVRRSFAIAERSPSLALAGVGLGLYALLRH
jgi:4-amino-4-deoxy-L-arabinose transferase-like glycosyltransferase